MAPEAEGARQRGLGLTSPLSCTNLALGWRPDTAAGGRGRPSACQAWRKDGARAFLAAETVVALMFRGAQALWYGWLFPG